VAVAHLEKLNTLSIPEIPDNPSEMPIPSLENLHIEKFGSAENFRAFVRLHTNIKSLSMKWINSELSNDVLNDVTLRLPYLENVVFGPCYEITQLTYDMLERNCKNLQTIYNFKFCDDENPFMPSNAIPKICYFVNDSTIKSFKRPKSMWDAEVFNYHFLVRYESDYDDDSESLESHDSDDIYSDDDYYNEQDFLDNVFMLPY
jgi:hypothetical protein